MTRHIPDRDADLEGFFALLGARCSPNTVAAYRRDLTALGSYLEKRIADATVEELERYVAQLRADGLSTSTIARRTAAARSICAFAAGSGGRRPHSLLRLGSFQIWYAATRPR